MPVPYGTIIDTGRPRLVLVLVAALLMASLLCAGVLAFAGAVWPSLFPPRSPPSRFPPLLAGREGGQERFGRTTTQGNWRRLRLVQALAAALSDKLTRRARYSTALPVAIGGRATAAASS